MEKIRKILIEKGSKTGHKYYVTDLSKDFHTKFGSIKADELKKAEPGEDVTSNRNEKFTVIAPEFIDNYKRMKRGAQIIILKDIGHIIAETGINKSSRVLDAGAGSGAFALFLANIAKEVISYEIDADNYALVQENIKFLGFENIKLKNKDIYQGIDEKELDVILFDLPEPQMAVKHAVKALKIGGFLVNYSPCITSSMEFIEEARKHDNFLILNTVELTETNWSVEGKKVRPLSKGIGHTGFISFVRKVR